MRSSPRAGALASAHLYITRISSLHAHQLSSASAHDGAASLRVQRAKDDVYERARCAMFGVGLESQHDYLPQRLRSALRKSSPWSAASADLNGAPPPPPLPNDRRPRVRTPVGQRPSSSPCSCTHTCTACAPAAHAPRCWQRILLTTNNPGAQVLQAAADARARALCYVWAVLGCARLDEPRSPTISLKSPHNLVRPFWRLLGRR